MIRRRRWSVYIVRCGDETLYTGVALDVERRRREHESGAGARYTRGRGPIRLVYAESAPSYGAALSREYALKRLSRAEKLALAAGWRAHVLGRGRGHRARRHP